MSGAPTPLPTRARLLELLEYDEESGALRWRYRPDAPKSRNARWAGKPALACVNADGYHHGTIEGRTAYAHRVIFKMMTGLEPPQIDHDDGDKGNNRWRNLFAATAVDNARNAKARSTNRSGRTGVHRAKGGRWAAQIRTGRGKRRHLGTFSSFDDAVAARVAAEAEIGFRVRA